ncbi:MAG: hypothetical protein R2857_11580 [Vampirovibrionales bacterium]
MAVELKLSLDRCISHNDIQHPFVTPQQPEPPGLYPPRKDRINQLGKPIHNPHV